MTIKKLTFCILCSVNAANLATEEDFNNEKSSNSEVEEKVLMNKNNWNTRKWGDIYFLFPHMSIDNINGKNYVQSFCVGDIGDFWLNFFNFIASGVIEYKYMFRKYYGINVRLNLNNMETNIETSDQFSFFSLEPSLEWIYGRKGKHIFSGSFSPLGFAFVQNEKGELPENFIKNMWNLNFFFLKYEYDRRFYLNFGKIKTSWFSLKNICEEVSWMAIVVNFISIEFGLNIIGVNDWRKKRKENIET